MKLTILGREFGSSRADKEAAQAGRANDDVGVTVETRAGAMGVGQSMVEKARLELQAEEIKFARALVTNPLLRAYAGATEQDVAVVASKVGTLMTGRPMGEYGQKLIVQHNYQQAQIRAAAENGLGRKIARDVKAVGRVLNPMPDLDPFKPKERW